MGKIEDKTKRRVRVGKIEKTVIGIIGTAGVISLAVLAPAATPILKPISKSIKKHKQKGYFKKVIKRLEKKGLVKVKRSGGKTWVELTPAGETQAILVRTGKAKIKKPKRWDKKWRVVIFDIKERQKRRRDLLRLALVNIGFIQLQASVWVYPYDVEDLIALLKADFQIGKDVLYMVVDEIENDKGIKKRFGLK